MLELSYIRIYNFTLRSVVAEVLAKQKHFAGLWRMHVSTGNKQIVRLKKYSKIVNVVPDSENNLKYCSILSKIQLQC